MGRRSTPSTADPAPPARRLPRTSSLPESATAHSSARRIATICSVSSTRPTLPPFHPTAGAVLHARPRDSRRCRAAHLAFRPAQRAGAVCRAALVSAISGFAEAPALSPEGLSLHYHARVNSRFVIFRVTREPKAGEVHLNGCPQPTRKPSPPARRPAPPS